MKYLIPQPFVAMAGQAWAVKNAAAWNRTDPDVQAAGRVFAYALTRMAMAGAFMYALNKYKPDTRIASVAMGVVSAPATLMYWGGKLVVDGLKAVKQGLASPAFSKDFVKSFFTKDVAAGMGTYLVGVAVLSSHNVVSINGFRGLGESVMARLISPARFKGDSSGSPDRPY
ncbi:MAG: hypothetical protein H7A38_02105 [Chlamydiales bacterium]|nr:hypothetical protein [Chlamydiales bacterium]